MYDVNLILSKSTYRHLTKLLNICNVCQPSRHESAYSDLRTELGELFTIKMVSLYPDDVIIELAETIQDLYIERDNLENYTHHTEKYLQMKIVEYRKKRDRLIHKANWEKSKSDGDPMKSLKSLDLIYLANSYNNGYHKNKANMYRLLLSVIDQIKEEVL